jgi:hypothetical protein
LKGSYCLLRVQHCYIMKHIPKKSDMFRANWTDKLCDLELDIKINEKSCVPVINKSKG